MTTHFIRRLSVLVAVFAVAVAGSLAVMPQAFAEPPSVVVGGIKYSIDASTYEATVIGCDTIPEGGAVTIPRTVTVDETEYTVTAIGDDAFYNCSSLTSITIPSTVGSIGDYAFYNCSSLTSITIPNSVTRIGNVAFQSCTSLTSVSFADGSQLKSIGKYAFQACRSLSGITIPSGVESIELYAFASAGLESIAIPDSVVSIGQSVFYGASDLKNIYFGGTKRGWENISKGSGWDMSTPEDKVIHYGKVEVAFDSNGHGGQAPDTAVIATNTKPSDDAKIGKNGPQLTEAEYVFGGWYTDKACTDANKFDFGLPLQEDVTLYAKWAPVTYGVIVVDGAASPEQAVAGETVTIEADDPPIGKFFKWWETSDGVVFADAASSTTTFTMPAKSVMITAVYGNILVGPAGGTVDDPIADQMYTGSEIKPALKVELEGADGLFLEGVDYDVKYENNVKVGTARATVILKGKWVGSTSVNFKITPADISGATVEVNNRVYSGIGLEPKVTVKWNGKTLVKGTDYTLSYRNNVQVGKASVDIVGKGNFAGSLTGTFDITKCPLTVTADSAERVYDGTPLTVDGFSSVGLAAGDRIESAKVVGAQTEVGSSKSSVLNVKIVNADGQDVTDCYNITYKPGTLTVKPAPKPTASPTKPAPTPTSIPSVTPTAPSPTGTPTGTPGVKPSGTPSAGPTTPTPNTCSVVDSSKQEKVYRLYNPVTSEHLFTTDAKEYEALAAKHGWNQEGVAWVSPDASASSVGVYRLYNPGLGDHHYTKDQNEAAALVSKFGWVYDNDAKPLFYSDDSCARVPVYRQYNPALTVGQHHYTADEKEAEALISKHGWKKEGVGWYALSWK